MEQVNGTRIIDSNGDWTMNFEGKLNLTAVNAPVGVVSIFGPQSSGKSTLLNDLFCTGFEVLDAIAAKGERYQTTKGIWAAKVASPQGCILVIDTEGTDGEEREGDTKFEKQTASFSLAVSNIVMINMNYTTVGTNNAAGWPLLTTVFEVMLWKIKNPNPKPVRLLFVVRDTPQQPVEKLLEQVTKKVQKIWTEMANPETKANDKLEKYFQIEVVPLSNYEYMKRRFETEVASLRENIVCWMASCERFAASCIADYAKNIWDEIKKNKDLDLPHQRILVAQARCKTIAEEKYQSFRKDECWLRIKEQVAKSPDVALQFGKNVSSIYVKYLYQYDADTQCYHAQRDEYKELLRENLLKEIEQTYYSLVKHMYQVILKKFFDAALEEINEDTALNNLMTKDYMTEFRNKLQDAAVEPANLNHAAKLIAKLKSTMDAIIAIAAREANELREWKKGVTKLNAENKWLKRILWSTAIGATAGFITAATLPVSIGISIPIMVSTGTAAVATGAAAPFMKTGKEKNTGTAESLASLMASILKRVSEIENIDWRPSSRVAKTIKHEKCL